MKPRRRRPLSACLALISVLATTGLAGAGEMSPVEWGKTSTGYRTLKVETDNAYGTTAEIWCGNDVVYVRSRMGDGMFLGGDLLLVNTRTGKRRTLKADIFKFFEEVFTDLPEEYITWDAAGIFEASPLACSPEGDWLFYSGELYDKLAPFNDRRHDLRALHLATGQDHLLSRSRSRVLSVSPSPDGKQLFVVFSGQVGTGYHIGEWSGEPPTWKPVELAGNFRYIGWRAQSGKLVALAKEGTEKYPLGFYEVSAAEPDFQPLGMPPLYREWVEARGAKVANRWIRGVRQDRIVGNMESKNAVFFSCGTDGKAWNCRESEPLEARARVWSRDGESFFYQKDVLVDGRTSPGGITLHDLATGRETIITSGGSYADILGGDISPAGDKLLLGYHNLKILYLQPPPQ